MSELEKQTNIAKDQYKFFKDQMNDLSIITIEEMILILIRMEFFVAGHGWDTVN